MKPLFSAKAIQDTMDAFLEKTDDEIIATLYYMGEDFVTACKDSGNYHDRTGNLRSSIGCVVIKNGSIVEQISYGSNPEGVTKGDEFAEELKMKYPVGCFLVVYAGMHYAIYVETKGYSVISSFLPGSDGFAKLLSELL